MDYLAHHTHNNYPGSYNYKNIVTLIDSLDRD